MLDSDLSSLIKCLCFKSGFNKELKTLQVQSAAAATLASLPLWPTSQSLPTPATVGGVTIMTTLQDPPWRSSLRKSGIGVTHTHTKLFESSRKQILEQAAQRKVTCKCVCVFVCVHMIWEVGVEG